MKKIERLMALLVCLFSIGTATVAPSQAEEALPVVVGRIFYAEGELLRYVPEEEDWVAVVRDAPFGAENTLYSGTRGMAELIVPNGTWARIGNNTQIQFITLDADLSEVDVASGVARIYNRSSNTVIKTTSPFGYVLADPDTVFDFYVGDNSVEVVPLKGNVSFVHAATQAKYDVAAGSPSILADQQQVASGEGTVDRDWTRWNTDREGFWAAKARVRGRSVEYLPASLRDEAYVLEENGRWERVPYEGEERWFWRPRVVAGWSPFTVGRWTDWDGDQTWIPAEPFGYVTHHYGNWIYVRNYWYWAPPVVSVRVGLPLLDVGFFWYPGRVSWIHRGTYVGWVPLAPRETYYGRRRWGDPHAVVVNNINITQININVRNYAYANHAVVVNHDDFYRVNSYRDVRRPNINRTTIINNYSGAPVVSNVVINNYTKIKERYNYTNVRVREKPHNTVVNRIRQNRTIIREGKKERAPLLQERVKSIPEGRVNRETRIEAPRVTNYIVPAAEVNRPRSEMKLQQREIKRNGRGAPQAQPGRAGRPERGTPARPEQPERTRPGRGAPEDPRGRGEKTGRPERPTEGPRRVDPARPEAERPRGAGKPVPQPAKTEQERPERVVPAKPGQSERVKSAPGAPERPDPQGKKPGRPEKPSAGPERAGTARPEAERPRGAGKPVPPPGAREQAPPERAVPAKPGQAERAKPEPGVQKEPSQKGKKPGRPEKPTAGPEGVGPTSPAHPGRLQGVGKPVPPPGGPKKAPPKRVVPGKPGQSERDGRPKGEVPEEELVPLEEEPGQSER